MSYTRTEEEGKDVLMFLSAEDAVVLESAPDSSIGGSLASGTAVETGTTPQEAYNEETGEINWDCPCLGPMTQPPCGETFKAAFSCFVYSKEDPKGIDCGGPVQCHAILFSGAS
ncbi:mitochondrial intermembrane space import and assembly protein 40 [Batrachochytrium salamandrivorans]|nr:mitochondrial intermembrane space import and assembly protein 40 [Batrachochytrium salamandrivorans]